MANKYCWGSKASTILHIRTSPEQAAPAPLPADADADADADSNHLEGRPKRPNRP